MGVLKKNIPNKLALMGRGPGLRSDIPVRQAQGKTRINGWGEVRSYLTVGSGLSFSAVGLGSKRSIARPPAQALRAQASITE